LDASGEVVASQVDGLRSRGGGSRDGFTCPISGTGVTVTATEEEVLLRERFPPRGRMVEARTRRL
jgi:hypothetical protein